MRNKVAKKLRAKANSIDANVPLVEYIEKTYHKIGADKNGDILYFIDPIRLTSFCVRKTYKNFKKRYKYESAGYIH